MDKKSVSKMRVTKLMILLGCAALVLVLLARNPRQDIYSAWNHVDELSGSQKLQKNDDDMHANRLTCPTRLVKLMEEASKRHNSLLVSVPFAKEAVAKIGMYEGWDKKKKLVAVDESERTRINGLVSSHKNLPMWNEELTKFVFDDGSSLGVNVTTCEIQSVHLKRKAVNDALTAHEDGSVGPICSWQGETCEKRGSCPNGWTNIGTWGLRGFRCWEKESCWTAPCIKTWDKGGIERHMPDDHCFVGCSVAVTYGQHCFRTDYCSYVPGATQRIKKQAKWVKYVALGGAMTAFIPGAADISKTLKLFAAGGKAFSSETPQQKVYNVLIAELRRMQENTVRCIGESILNYQKNHFMTRVKTIRERLSPKFRAAETTPQARDRNVWSHVDFQCHQAVNEVAALKGNALKEILPVAVELLDLCMLNYIATVEDMKKPQIVSKYRLYATKMKNSVDQALSWMRSNMMTLQTCGFGFDNVAKFYKHYEYFLQEVAFPVYNIENGIYGRPLLQFDQYACIPSGGKRGNKNAFSEITVPKSGLLQRVILHYFYGEMRFGLKYTPHHTIDPSISGIWGPAGEGPRIVIANGNDRQMFFQQVTSASVPKTPVGYNHRGIRLGFFRGVSGVKKGEKLRFYEKWTFEHPSVNTLHSNRGGTCVAVELLIQEDMACVPAASINGLYFGSAVAPQSGYLNGVTLRHVSGYMSVCRGNSLCDGFWSPAWTGNYVVMTNDRDNAYRYSSYTGGQTGTPTTPYVGGHRSSPSLRMAFANPRTFMIGQEVRFYQTYQFITNRRNSGGYLGATCFKLEWNFEKDITCIPGNSINGVYFGSVVPPQFGYLNWLTLRHVSGQMSVCNHHTDCVGNWGPAWTGMPYVAVTNDRDQAIGYQGYAGGRTGVPSIPYNSRTTRNSASLRMVFPQKPQVSQGKQLRFYQAFQYEQNMAHGNGYSGATCVKVEWSFEPDKTCIPSGSINGKIYGSIKVPRAGTLREMVLRYISGSMCTRGVSCSNHWGPSWTGCYVVPTDSQDRRLPVTAIHSGGATGRPASTYNYMSASLLFGFNKHGVAGMSVTQGQEIRFYQAYQWENNLRHSSGYFGATCVRVEFYFA